MNKKIISTIIFILLFGILFFPYNIETYKDGGTKIYSSLTYQYIKFNTLEGCKASKLEFAFTKKDYKYFESLLCKKGESEKDPNLKFFAYGAEPFWNIKITGNQLEYGNPNLFSETNPKGHIYMEIEKLEKQGEDFIFKAKNLEGKFVKEECHGDGKGDLYDYKVIFTNKNAEYKGCGSVEKQENFLKNKKPFSYSNITDQKTQNFIKNTLKKYNISEKNIQYYFYYVDYFNDAVGKEGLTNGNFKDITNFSRDGGYPMYLEKLEKKNFDFGGTNCRITSFTLFKDLVNIENLTDKASLILNFDKSSIDNFPKKIFDETEKKKFLTFFAGIPTPLTKDKQVHLKNIKKYFKEHNIKFNTKPGFSVISMINHDDLDNILFIGHIGILLESEGKFVFLEKLSFDLPYQAVIFDKKSQVHEYFMKKYGDMTTPETADPFLMENGEEFEVEK
ncbi:DUF4300 family protein [Candidatus Gracilibacteria bacterium]|nr:DUF4300 family protein [Candidatus Gracilibacteria bacterium]